MIAALLLAAGRSSRFGADKLVAPLGGRPVIRWSAEALASRTDVTYVVVPPDHPAIEGALHGLDVVFVPHEGRDEGLGSSIGAGIAALPHDTEAVVIALADQPFISPTVVARLVARWRAGGASAVAPRYRNGRGHPVLFDRTSFVDLLSLRGDVGARIVLEALGDRGALIDVEGAVPIDVDTPAALLAIARELDDAGVPPSR